ncbi:hypothetical protein [Candidatus Tisiphia endosymbiont of Nemotelus uliginosus]|uniref:hypothetical protein n=1 Tax=Candidatus Tisiphia endosymbiont of Nemotelus uliginosus TaxID=3077926 RepID=UPI0035C8C42D
MKNLLAAILTFAFSVSAFAATPAVEEADDSETKAKSVQEETVQTKTKTTTQETKTNESDK